MNTFDLAALIIVVVSTALGLYWGVIRQILSVLGLLVGIAVAGRYGGEVALWLTSFITSEAFAGVLGFFIVLIFVSVLASLVASLLRIFVGLLFLGWLDQALGAVLGLIQGVLICAILAVGLVTFRVPELEQTIQTSVILESLLRVGNALTFLLPDAFRTAVQNTLGR
ncbi:MAG: CvpA family protein [Chloroflexaceae bacterium]|jgi:membrane protein required for colicin V production|nr:CvpA family protein [Chloroflexaceae bacterium]